eukprot:15088287-Alexandrium_andersonii.AAC.1
MTACGPSEVRRCECTGGRPATEPWGWPPARPSRPGRRPSGVEGPLIRGQRGLAAPGPIEGRT